MCYYCCGVLLLFFFKQKTAYDMRISDWSSDVCSSDLGSECGARRGTKNDHAYIIILAQAFPDLDKFVGHIAREAVVRLRAIESDRRNMVSDIKQYGLIGHSSHTPDLAPILQHISMRSEEHTSELKSLMRISSAVFY